METSISFKDQRTAGTALIPRRALSRALCGHCAGTARALCRTRARPRACSPRVLSRRCIRKTIGQSCSQPTFWNRETLCTLFEVDVHVLTHCGSPPCNDPEALEKLRMESNCRRWTTGFLPPSLQARLCLRFLPARIELRPSTEFKIEVDEYPSLRPSL